MTTKKSALELLIEHPKNGSSEERRDLLRLNTNSFITAPDRYGNRDMEFFDLLFSRTLLAMDKRLRRGLAMAMAKSGVPKDHVKKMLRGETSTVSQILRRSATQTREDILICVRERTTALYKAPLRTNSSADILSNTNRFTLPKLLLEESYRYIFFSQRHYVATLQDQNLLDVLGRTAKRFRPKIIEDSQTEVRDDITHARKFVNDKLRRNTLNEDYLSELLETSGSVEFTFALAALLKIDLTTSQRVLNDTSWETLALACRSAKVSRAFFAKLTNSMQRRQSDQPNMERIIGLYNKIPEDAAERVMRFLQIRIASLADLQEPAIPELPKRLSA